MTANLLLAAGYFLLGRASLLLAIPPGFAAPIWPAAGLALTALLARRSLWPGVLLGHFLVNLSMQGLSVQACLLSFVIASAGTAQALLGYHLVVRWGGFPNNLGRGVDIIRFMLLAGPAACVVSPTVGVAVLWLAGLIAAPEAPFSWGTWWAGDALGVLLIAPAGAVAVGTPGGWRQRRTAAVALALLVTLAAATGIFVLARQHETERIDAEFQVDASSLHNFLDKEADVYLEFLRSLRYFFHSSKEVDRDEFRSFTSRAIERHDEFIALSWNELVPASRRAAWTAARRGEGFPDVAIRELGPDGRPRPAASRASYIPVTFIEPLAENRSALGFDVGSDPVRREAFDSALDAGEPHASAAITLVQGAQARVRRAFLVAVPVFTPGPRPTDERQRRARVRGFVVAVLSLDRLARDAIRLQARPGLAMEVYDDEAGGRPEPLFVSTIRPGDALATTLPFEMAGRRWRIRYSIDNEEYARRRSATPWLVLGGVVAFTLVLSVFLLMVTGHADAVESEVRQRTAELDSQKTLLRSIIDNMGEGVAVADAGGRFILFNEAAERILGVGPGTAPPEQWSDHFGVFDKDARTPFPAGALPLTRAIRGEASDDVELFIRNPTVPEGVYLSVTARPLTTPDGAPNGGVAVFRDITARRKVADELRRAKSEAEAAAAAKSAFLANMSHEIRTPMNAVVGTAGLLQASRLDEEQKDLVRTLRSAADSLLAVVNDILDFSRFEAGKVPLEEREFDLEHAIHGVLLMLQPQAEAKGIDLAFFCDSGLPKRLRGDAGRLRQVLLNLAGNAVKFTSRGGVSLEVRRDPGSGPDAVRFSVRDTGIGIPAEVQPLLFAPFTQAEASTSRRFGGTGLGLAISKRIVEAMGGQVELRSRVGEGSEFSFTVPLRPADGSPARSRALPSNFKVLVIDDNAVNRRVFSQQLTSWEMEGWAAEDAAEARRLLADARASGKPFDLVISDHRMPGEDGPSFARSLKADPAYAALPLILASSSAPGPIPAEFAARVSKPVSPSALLNAILDVLHPTCGLQPGDGKAASPLGDDCSHLRVLLVDDNPVNVKVGTLQLSKFGIVPDTANNGEDALAGAAVNRYDLILLDCQMPVMDGFQTVKELRRREGGKRRTPVIALTANALEGDRETCLAAGMDDYLAKPVTMESLTEALRRWDAPLDPNVLSDLRALADGQDEVLKEILAAFVADAPPTAAAALAAADAGDKARLKEAAHKLKGSSGSVGARRVASLAGKLEALAKAGDLAGAPALAAALSAALDAAVEAARSLTSGQA